VKNIYRWLFKEVIVIKGLRQIAIVVLVSLAIAARIQISHAQATNGPAATAQQEQKRMTNSDVVRMVQERRNESEIIREVRAAFQSGDAAFDVSPTALVELHKDGVSNNILNAMMGDGSAKPGTGGTRGANPAPARGSTSTDGLNPQPLPPNARVQERLSRTKLATGPVLKLSGARPSLDPNVMQALQQQSSQAHIEKAQLGQPAIKSGLPSSGNGPSKMQTAQQPMLLSRGNGIGQLGAGKTMGADGSSGDPAGSTPPNPAGGATPGSTPGTPGGATPGAGGNTPPGTNGGSPSGKPISMAAMTHAPAPISACRFNATTPVVETVSGRSPKSIYFTPDPGNDANNPSNQYTIRGCNFGAARGQGEVHLVGAFQNNPSPVRLGIDSWSDNLVVVTLDPTFRNEYDLDNITLVVTNANGLGAQFTGNHFVARRASRSLTRIPNSLVKLPTTYLATDKFVSPATAQNLQLAKMPNTSLSASILFYVTTALWTSNAGDGYPQQRLSFTDVIDFSKLHSGFAVDPNIQTFVPSSASLSSDPVVVGAGGSCKFYDTVVDASLQGSSMFIGVQPEECDDGGKFIFAYYGLAISVTGPVGDKLDPWLGGLN
jgi:hypothetical protein